jgi:hypothetical protein
VEDYSRFIRSRWFINYLKDSLHSRESMIFKNLNMTALKIQKEQNLLSTVAAAIVVQTKIKETKMFRLQTQQRVSAMHVELDSHSGSFMILLQSNYILVLYSSLHCLDDDSFQQIMKAKMDGPLQTK